MKTTYSILVIFFLFLASTCPAQPSFNNFQAEENDVVWQKVYGTTLTFDQLQERVKDAGLLINTEIRDKKITGDIRPIDADYKGAGFSRFLIDEYIWSDNFSGFAILDFQEGKYRVTIKRIVAIYSGTLGKIGLKNWALNRKNEIKDSFKKSPGKILDYTFTQKFDFKEKSDKW